jgi:hypothetical protein
MQVIHDHRHSRRRVSEERQSEEQMHEGVYGTGWRVRREGSSLVSVTALRARHDAALSSRYGALDAKDRSAVRSAKGEETSHPFEEAVLITFMLGRGDFDMRPKPFIPRPMKPASEIQLYVVSGGIRIPQCWLAERALPIPELPSQLDLFSGQRPAEAP